MLLLARETHPRASSRRTTRASRPAEKWLTSARFPGFSNVSAGTRAPNAILIVTRLIVPPGKARSPRRLAFQIVERYPFSRPPCLPGFAPTPDPLTFRPHYYFYNSENNFSVSRSAKSWTVSSVLRMEPAASNGGE